MMMNDEIDEQKFYVSNIRTKAKEMAFLLCSLYCCEKWQRLVPRAAAVTFPISLCQSVVSCVLVRARVCVCLFVFVRCVAHLFFFLLINGSARQSDLFYTFVLSSFCIIELSFNDKICAASRPLALSLPPPLCPRVYHCMWVCRIIAITIILKLLQVWRNSLR